MAIILLLFMALALFGVIYSIKAGKKSKKIKKFNYITWCPIIPLWVALYLIIYAIRPDFENGELIIAALFFSLPILLIWLIARGIYYYKKVLVDGFVEIVVDNNKKNSN